MDNLIDIIKKIVEETAKETVFKTIEEQQKQSKDHQLEKSDVKPEAPKILEAPKTEYKEIQCDDGFYKGHVLNGKKHGKGIMEYKTGVVYDGDWVDDKECGYCVCTYDEKSEYLKYEGEAKNNVRHGKGKLYYKTGKIFEGNFEESEIVNGKFTFENGDTLEFKEDMYNGTYTYNDSKNVYTGKLDSKLKRNCLGTLLYKDGSKYDGMWLNNEMHGQGTYTCTEYTYNGIWTHNQMHGLGIYTSSLYKYTISGNFSYGKVYGIGQKEFMNSYDKKCIYNGNFKDSLFNGDGELKIFDNKNQVADIYKGNFVSNKPDGMCTYTSILGKKIIKGIVKENYFNDDAHITYTEKNIIYEGKVFDDKPSGNGKITYPDGSYYVGYVISNLHRSGNGTMNYCNGVAITTKWENNKAASPFIQSSTSDNVVPISGLIYAADMYTDISV